MEPQHTYLCIDLKSFYASAECVERGLDPLTTNLVVADPTRTEKTICLAVSPSLKSYGIPRRPRLFEVVQKITAVNAERRRAAPGRRLEGESYSAPELAQNASLAVGYITAMPQMAKYIRVSTQIYQIYLQYVAETDIHVYSIDEVFMDVTHYLALYKLSAHELAMKIVREVLHTTGITATAGIGTNLYLGKVAMDIVAKHVPADADGVRIAELDEQSYRRLLWGHRPLTDFWRVGPGYAKKLEECGLYTMGDIARCSIGEAPGAYTENLLYKMFGVNAELLIDHAWGWEPCTMAEIKAYKPADNSISSGQVIHCAYDFAKARLIVREMTDQLVLDLVAKQLVTDQMGLMIGYDVDSLKSSKTPYTGPVTADRYGRRVPKPAHGSIRLRCPTSSTKEIMDAVMTLYDKIVDPNLLVRRVNVTAGHLMDESKAGTKDTAEQLDLFTDYAAEKQKRAEEQKAREREKKLQEAMLSIKGKFGKNAILKGMNFEEGATTIERNAQIGGHKA